LNNQSILCIRPFATNLHIYMNSINLDNLQTIFKLSKNFLDKRFNEYDGKKLTFHTRSKLYSTFRDFRTIAAQEPVTEEHIQTGMIALVFSHLGFLEDYDNPIEAAKGLAKFFLDEIETPRELTNQILVLIGATKPTYVPKNTLEMVVHDAVIAYWGKKKFKSRLKRRLTEFEQQSKKNINQKDWLSIEEKFFEKANFHSPVAIEKFGERKEKNNKKFTDLIKDIDDVKKENSFSTDSAAKMIFKVALRNHIDLTSIGDQKANIMLSINAIILSIGIPLLSRYADKFSIELLPAFTFILTCVISMTLAALATRPAKMDGSVDIDKLNSGKSDIFFFGNFYGIKQETYQQLIRKIMDDRKLMDDSIINHLYFLGDILGTKFIYLRRCYNTFIGGFVLSLFLFMLTYLIYHV